MGKTQRQRQLQEQLRIRQQQRDESERRCLRGNSGDQVSRESLKDEGPRRLVEWSLQALPTLDRTSCAHSIKPKTGE
jgi:hypothetical protein